MFEKHFCYNMYVCNFHFSLFRIRGPVLTMAFFDCSANTLHIREDEPLENVKPICKAPSTTNSMPSTASSVTIVNENDGGGTSGGGTPSGDQQIAVFCTEKSAAVYSLPSQRQMYTQTINESTYVVTAAIINFGGVKYTPCLTTYTADGFVRVFSLPSLRPLLDMYFVANTGFPLLLARSMNFSNFAHGLFFINPTEVQKFSISTEFMRQLSEMKGRVWTADIPMPEPPKQGFLKGASSLLFGGGPKPLDREELFGEGAGKPNSGVAQTIKGGNMDALTAKAGGGTSEIGKAKDAMIERGQKLNEIEDQVENMSNEAKIYAQNCQALKNHYKNKKWYQW